MSIFSVGGSTPAADSAVESKSVRLDRASTAYLKKAFPFSTNKKTWTFSCWSKRADVATGYQQGIFASDTPASPGDISGLDWWDTGALCWRDWRSGSTNNQLITTALYRDPAAWYHIVVAYDTTQATASNRIKIYVNGEQVTDFSTANYPSQNYEGAVNYGTSSLDRLHGIGHNTGFNDSSSQYIAEVNFLDGTALDASYFGETDSDTNQWKPKAAADIKAAVTFGEHGFYLPFSNDALAASFLDTGSGSRHTVTAVGNVHTDTTIKKLGTASAQFDGTGDALTCPDSSDFTLVDAMFTLEAYVYLSNTNRQVFISKYDESGNNREFKWEYDSNNMMFGYSTNGSSNTWLSFAWTPSVDTWYHIAVSRDGSSNLRAFVDGTQIGTTQVVTGSFHNGSALLSIGVNIHNGSPFNSGLTGYMDEIRICNIGKYTYNFTPPTVAFESDTRTKLLLHCDGSDGGTSFTDSATHTITANGDAKNTRVVNNPVGYQVDATGGSHIAGPKFGTGCASFTKSASGANYLSVADSNDWTLGSTFTLEGWFNFDDVANNDLTLMNHWKGNGVLTAWSWQIDSGTTVKFFYSTNGTSSAGNSSWTWTPQNHRWYHLAIVRNSADLMFFVDGTQVDSTYNISSSTIANIAWPLELGYYSNIGGYKFKGYMDEVRISDNARYTSAFTPSTSAFSNDGNTKLLMHCDGTHGSTSFTDSSSTGHTITQNGDVRILAPKIGTGGYRNNGSGDGLMVPSANCPWAEFGTGDFTVEAWVSLDDITTDNQQFFTHRNSVNSGDWVFWWDATNGLQFSGSNDSLSQGGTTGWASNTWVHIAASRSGVDNRLFVNGTQVATNNSAKDYNATATLFIASYSTGTGGFTVTTGAMTGFMDEARITPGKALYTSNFTPTTTAYTDDIDTRLLMHFDGGGPGTAGSDTNVGQGQYYHDSSTNAVFYDSGVPKYKSVMEFDGSGDYLDAGNSSDWDFGSADFTIECWANADALPDQPRLIGDSGGNWYFRIGDCSGKKTISAYNGNFFCDDQHGIVNLGEWNHYAWSRASGTNRFFFNGNLISDSTITDASMTTTNLYIGGGVSSQDVDGKMDQIRISDNARYTANFTVPTDRFTSDSNTKLLIQSDFTEGGIGADHSGNYNYFTPNNLGAHDMVEDGPTNNFCTLNGADVDSGLPLTEGNLQGTNTGSAQWEQAGSTFIVPKTGKWYWESCIKQDKAHLMLFFDRSSEAYNGDEVANLYVWDFQSASNNIRYNTTAVATSDVAQGDIASVSVTDGVVKFYKNNVLAHTFTQNMSLDSKDYVVGLSAHSTSSGGQVCLNFGQDSSFAGYKNDNTNPQPDANGKGDFYYAPPADHLALCTDNLDDPAIALPGEHFNTKLYTGTAAELAVTGVGFQPDFTWIKTRALTYNHRVFDVVRGVTKEVYTNVANAEVTDAQSLKSFDSDGFTLGTGSGSNPSSTMVSWNWKAGGTASSNSDGSITSSVSANTTAGFSIVSYAGSGSAGATVGHGLSQTPDLIIIKNRSAITNWVVNSPITNSGFTEWALKLDLDQATSTDSTIWNNTAPTSSVFTLGTAGESNRNNPDNYIAYCFHSVEGYSKVGSYTGNGATDGPFIYTGFKPAFIMVKLVTAASGYWVMFDNKRDPDNPTGRVFYANETSISTDVSSYTPYDLLSNGFKSRIPAGNGNEASYNSSGQTYLYVAFAESPFKTANAR